MKKITKIRQQIKVLQERRQAAQAITDNCRRHGWRVPDDKQDIVNDCTGRLADLEQQLAVARIERSIAIA